MAVGKVQGLLAMLAAGCGGSTFTTRMVDTPAGEVVTYGAPRDPTYSVEAEPELDVLRLRVYRAARCDVIPAKVVHRRTETLDGDEVVTSVNQGRVQLAQPPNGTVPCDVGYARDAEVSLVVGNAVHRLGTTDATGRVAVNLSAELREKLFGAGVPDQASVRVHPPRAMESSTAGTVSLASLRDFEAGIGKLLAELEMLLGRGTAITGPEIQRSYTLYETLLSQGYHDPRVRAALARFWELFFARKQAEAAENLARNLKALESARALLRDAGDAAIPLFMQAAISSQTYDPRAFDWASGELFQALRRSPASCTSFDWTRIETYGFPLTARVAVHYLRFARGDDFFGSMSGVCRFVGR